MNKELAQLDIQSLDRKALHAVDVLNNASYVVIELISEIDRRRGYLDFGCASLFEYCIARLKMSEGSASLHIRAATLNSQFPEISEHIQDGTLSLSNLGQVQSFIKAEEKRTGEKLVRSVKHELVEMVKGKTQKEACRVLVEAMPEVPQVKERDRFLPGGKIAVTMVLPPHVQAKAERLRELTSHKNADPTWLEMFESLLDAELKRVDPLLKPVNAVSEKHVSEKSPSENPANEMAKLKKNLTQSFATAGFQRRSIKVSIKRAIHHRSQSQCEHIDKRTGERCKRKYHVQIDHIIPVAKGGSNELSNLQLLCRPHNLQKGTS